MKDYCMHTARHNAGYVDLNQFICDTCNACFSSKKSLEQHESSHSYSCYACDPPLKFATEMEYNNHKFMHEILGRVGSIERKKKQYDFRTVAKVAPPQAKYVCFECDAPNNEFHSKEEIDNHVHRKNAPIEQSKYNIHLLI